METVYRDDKIYNSCSLDSFPILNSKYFERRLDIGLVRELWNTTQTAIESNWQITSGRIMP